ncbi:unnamed protein product [Parnassius apollo]|uniref:(apollo) hypothetical protein n=1 Tax=Parnassius apollo TaxID=110799 RepID=A0A8S3X6L5_PARAO|nr:unnamed protein product [Parnassius apollo]
MACSEWQKIVTKIKAILTWFQQSCVASDELRKATSTETKLIQSVSTRWNSTAVLVIINDILFRHATAAPMLSSSEISIASSVLLILRPLEEATKEISADKYCTISKIIPLVPAAYFPKLLQQVSQENLWHEKCKNWLCKKLRKEWVPLNM